MSLQEAKMPSLADKINEKAKEEVEAESVEAKGRSYKKKTKK